MSTGASSTMDDWVRSEDGKETIREDSDAVIRRLIDTLRDIITLAAPGTGKHLKADMAAILELARSALNVHLGGTE